MNRERRAALLLAAGDGLTVFLLLAGGLWGYFSAYFYALDDLWRLLAVCVPAAAAGAARWSSRRGGWAALGLLGLIAVLACRPWDGAFLLPEALAAQWEASARVLPDTWTLALLTGALGLVLGWVVVWARAWYLAALLVIVPVTPAILAGVLPAWPALLAGASGWGSMLLTALYGRRDRERLGTGVFWSTAAMAAFLGLLTLAMPQEGYQRPQWATDARNNMFAFFSEGLDRLWSWGAEEWMPQAWLDGLGFEGGGTGAGPVISVEQLNGETVDLLAAGPRRYTGRSVLAVETDDESQRGMVYLRGGGAGRYTGHSWEALPTSGADYGGAHFPALTGTGERHTMTIRHMERGSMGFYPYRLAAMPDTLRRGDDSGGLMRLGREYEITYRPGGPAEGFQALEWDFAQLEAGYEVFVRENYLDVPRDAGRALTPLLEEVRRLTVSLDPAVPEQFRENMAAAARTAAVLALHADYSLTAPAMEEGEDFVEHFLAEGRGYCMHFATAGALLLRMQGIPARYVSGYACEMEGTGPVVVRDSNAHAWVEIYLSGYGWYPVEMTPGYQAEGGIEREEFTPDVPEEPERPDQPEAPEEPSPGQDQEEPEVPEETSSGAPEGPPLALTWLRRGLGALLVPAGLWGAYRLALLGRKRRREAADTNRSAIDAYRRCRRLEAWGGAMDPALEELARKAKFSQHTLTPEEREAAWSLLEAVRTRVDGALPWWKRWVFRLLKPAL